MNDGNVGYFERSGEMATHNDPDNVPEGNDPTCGECESFPCVCEQIEYAQYGDDIELAGEGQNACCKCGAVATATTWDNIHFCDMHWAEREAKLWTVVQPQPY